MAKKKETTITLSTSYSKMVKVNFKHVVAFLRKKNQIEFYYMNQKYTIDIDNDKNEYEIEEETLKEMILKAIKETDKEKEELEKKAKRAKKKQETEIEEPKTKKKVIRKGRKKKEEKLEEVPVQEKKKRGRPRKVR